MGKRIQVDTSGIGIGGRILMVVVALALIVVTGRAQLVAMVGRKTTATITETNISQTQGDEDDWETEAIHHFVYTVDGVEYTGTVCHSITDDDGYVNDGGAFGGALVPFDTEFIERESSRSTITVHYLPANPRVYVAHDGSIADPLSTALRAGVALLSLVLLFLALKPGGRRRGKSDGDVPQVAYARAPQAPVAPAPVFPVPTQVRTPSSQAPSAPQPVYGTQAASAPQAARGTQVASAPQHARVPQTTAQDASLPRGRHMARTSARPSTCPNCGAPLNGRNFCTTCGQKL